LAKGERRRGGDVGPPKLFVFVVVILLHILAPALFGFNRRSGFPETLLGFCALLGFFVRWRNGPNVLWLGQIEEIRGLLFRRLGRSTGFGANGRVSCCLQGGLHALIGCRNFRFSRWIFLILQKREDFVILQNKNTLSCTLISNQHTG
jgi:hypothetical protein